MDLREEARGRDEALDVLEERRAELIRIAKSIANAIHEREGRVTSPEVRAEMERVGYDMGDVDPRWMGAVFRAGTGWERIGWESTGSHCRPVAIWSRR